MRRLVLALGVLLVVLLVADRAGAAYGSRSLADQVQRTSALDARPDVDVTGFPFLTQALSGRYDRIDVRAADVPAGRLELARLDATLQGVRAPLTDLVAGAVTDVPVRTVTARAVVSYDQVSQQYEDRELVVEPDGERVRIRTAVDVLGQRLVAEALSRVEAVDGELVVTAEEIRLSDGSADSDLLLTLRVQLDRRVPVDDLPYDLALTRVTVRPEGVELFAAADDVVVRRS